MPDEIPCVYCQQPIDPRGEYFWGRHGGEWHVLCLARHDAEIKAACDHFGLFIAGRWHRNGMTDPQEYTDEVQRLRNSPAPLIVEKPSTGTT